MIDAATGALSYTGAGEDYESETASYALTVRASDGSLHADATVTVTVTDVAEAPSFAETSYAFDWQRTRMGARPRWRSVRCRRRTPRAQIDQMGAHTLYPGGTLPGPYLRGIYDADGD